MNRGRKKTPTVIQMEAVECGAACLCIILGSFGRYVPLAQLRQECGVSRDGSNAANLFRAARRYGLEGKGFRLPVEDLYNLETPFIVFWEANHYIVVEGFDKKGVYINDPGTGPRFISHHEFEESYFGIVLTFTLTSAFKKGGERPNAAAEVYNRLKPIKFPILYLVVAGLCLLLPGLALPAFIRFFTDHVIVTPALGSGTLFLIAMAMVLLMGGILFSLQNYVLNRLNSRLSIQFGSQFLWHILRLPISFYAQRFPGEIAWRTTINERVAQQMTGALANTCIDVLLITFYGIVMMRYDVLIGSIGFFAVILNVGLFLWIQRARRDAYARLHQEEAKWIGNVIGALQQIETIKAVGLESDFFVKFAGLYTRNLNAQGEISKKDAILGTAPIAIQSLSMAALLTIGGWKIMEGHLTFGMLIALQSLMIAFLTPIARFVNLGQVMQNTGTDIVRLDDVLKNKIDPIYEARNEVHEGGRLEGYLEFKNVTFGYSELAPPLIKQLNFSIKPGQRLALVGPSGCGKSTLAKLAAGLFLPWEGEILYDGKPIKQIPSDVFYHSLGYIDQQIFLFSGTIYDNLTLWNPAVAEEMVIRAADDAAIHEDILLRPNGYQNRLIEGGKNLSGGQQQRLEIARALLYSPSILIMDEATSALDSHSEKSVSDNIRRRGCSALMIAHRLSTIQDCDEIIVLDKGNVSQRGTHAQLREQPGIYKELIESE